MKRKSTLAEGDRALERNGRRGTRTPEGVRQQIYSLPSLPLEYPPKSNVARTAERALWHSHRDGDCITTLPLANPKYLSKFTGVRRPRRTRPLSMQL